MKEEDTPVKVLLVEDDVDVSLMYGSQLELDQHGVTYARTAQEALDLMEEAGFDVVVLDILLPGSNGIAVLQELQGYEDWRGIPVVVLSNLDIKDLGVSENHLHDLGVRQYLVKMRTTPGDLSSAVTSAV
ncbi:hypothetical protein BRC21_01185 [Candidatus Saccharibacteria bacterium SW_7_54_9]|nr:MAG: hypothetical protein BRC21_01185 [Candidatus Saccharibacteria bacterium SW_7_54_9]